MSNPYRTLHNDVKIMRGRHDNIFLKYFVYMFTKYNFPVIFPLLRTDVQITVTFDIVSFINQHRPKVWASRSLFYVGWQTAETGQARQYVCH